MTNKKTNVAIIGVGKGGAALLETLEGDELCEFELTFATS